MNDPQGPGAGNIVAGIFLILAGLCLTLLGGGCTLLFLSEFQSMFAGDAYTAWPLFLVSIAILGGGIAMIWLGVRLMSGKFNK